MPNKIFMFKHFLYFSIYFFYLSLFLVEEVAPIINDEEIFIQGIFIGVFTIITVTTLLWILNRRKRSNKKFKIRLSVISVWSKDKQNIRLYITDTLDSRGVNLRLLFQHNTEYRIVEVNIKDKRVIALDCVLFRDYSMADWVDLYKDRSSLMSCPITLCVKDCRYIVFGYPLPNYNHWKYLENKYNLTVETGNDHYSWIKSSDNNIITSNLIHVETDIVFFNIIHNQV